MSESIVNNKTENQTGDIPIVVESDIPVVVVSIAGNLDSVEPTILKKTKKGVYAKNPITNRMIKKDTDYWRKMYNQRPVHTKKNKKEPEPTPAPEPEPTPAPAPETTPAPEPEPTPAPAPETTPAPMSLAERIAYDNRKILMALPTRDAKRVLHFLIRDAVHSHS